MESVSRYHDFSCGHRVVDHEGACKHLHGHNYRAHFTLTTRPENTLDKLGRVIDFSVIKTTLCAWLEEHWDHKMLLWSEDPMRTIFDPSTDLVHSMTNTEKKLFSEIGKSIVLVPFNPTAEQMARFLLRHVSRMLLRNQPVYVSSIRLDETRKCWATAEYDHGEDPFAPSPRRIMPDGRTEQELDDDIPF